MSSDRKIEYQYYLSKYCEYHPAVCHKKVECDKLWTALRKIGGVDGPKWSKHSVTEHWPQKFHQETFLKLKKKRNDKNHPNQNHPIQQI